MLNQRYRALLGALTVAGIAVACAPSDADTGAKVKSNLTADTTVKTAAIDVDVQKKIVTLTGTVDTVAIKEQAVVVARKTDGVGDVVDQIVVKEQGSGPGHGREMMGKGVGSGEHREAPRDEKRP